MSDVDVTRESTHRRARSSLSKIVRKRPRKRFRGVPPPLVFDINKLPDSTLLKESETAAACRRAMSTLEVWRTRRDHPLVWRKVGGRIMYELPSVRAFLKGDTK